MKGIANILIILIIVISIGLVLVLPTGQANTNGLVLLLSNKDTIDSYFIEDRLKEEIIQEINYNISNVPEQLFELFGNNKINIFVTYDDESVGDFWVHTEGNRVVDFRKGARTQADIELRINENTIFRILESDDPFNEFLEAMNSGEIEHKGLTLGGTITSVTVGITTTVLGVVNAVVNFFGGLFG